MYLTHDICEYVSLFAIYFYSMFKRSNGILFDVAGYFPLISTTNRIVLVDCHSACQGHLTLSLITEERRIYYQAWCEECPDRAI